MSLIYINMKKIIYFGLLMLTSVMGFGQIVADQDIAISNARILPNPTWVGGMVEGYVTMTAVEGVTYLPNELPIEFTVCFNRISESSISATAPVIEYDVIGDVDFLEWEYVGGGCWKGYITKSIGPMSAAGVSFPGLITSQSATREDANAGNGVGLYIRLTRQHTREPNDDLNDFARIYTYTIDPPTCTPPTVTVAGGQLSASICLGQSIALTAANCTGTLAWYANGILLNGQTSTNITVNPSITTSYTATCSGASCSTSSHSVAVVVTVSPNPEITASAAPSPICLGQSSTLSVSGCNTSGSITWRNAVTNAIVGSGNNFQVTPAVSTSYTATCTNSCGNERTSNAVSVTVNPAVKPRVVPVSSSVCSGQSVTLTAEGCISDISWSSGQTNLTSITFNPVITNNYTVTCRTSCGVNTSDPVNVAVTSVPVVTLGSHGTSVSISTSQTSTVLTASCSGGGTPVWAGPGITGSVSNTNVTVQKSYITGSSAAYTATCGIAPCSDTKTVTVTKQMCPDPSQNCFSVKVTRNK